MQEMIDLTRFTGADEIVLSGRPKGEELREKLKLDEKEARAGEIKIKIIIPHHIVSLNSSFFLGLFTKSVQKFGEVGFQSKYEFDCRPILLNDIEAGIHQALNTSNPLAAAKK
jgi:hypothetical protein